MTYQFIPIFLVEFKFLHDFFFEDTKKWEMVMTLQFAVQIAFLLITQSAFL